MGWHTPHTVGKVSMKREITIKILPANWRTTLAGMLGAGATIALDMFTKGVIDPKTLAIAASIAAVSYLSKDAGVSGTEK